MRGLLSVLVAATLVNLLLAGYCSLVQADLQRDIAKMELFLLENTGGLYKP